ncbi:hypothetical protein JX266_005803 [Neoarthrinium moseri]|nr:hypothetical protein JX266_005803 [Neoarthrinium moseri]
MSSPLDTTADDGSRKHLEQITFRFCSECSNMLYPKEDQDSHKLQFTCRTCQYTEEATSTCIFRNLMNNAAGETAGVTQDVGSDPTVSIPSAAASASAHAAPQAGISAGDASGYLSGEFSGEYATATAQPTTGGHASNGGDLSHIPRSLHQTDFDLDTVIGTVTMASVYQCLDSQEKATWDGQFVAKVVSDTSFALASSWESVSAFDHETDEDPPEALGMEPEYGDLDMVL